MELYGRKLTVRQKEWRKIIIIIILHGKQHQQRTLSYERYTQDSFMANRGLAISC